MIVVDNGSIDGSPEAVEAAFPGRGRDPDGPMNAGFSGGVNAGIEAAIERGADAVLLLNNDMVVEPGFLGPLVAAALEPGVGGGVQPDPVRRPARPRLVRGRDVPAAARASRPQHRVRGAAAARLGGLRTRSTVPAAARC